MNYQVGYIIEKSFKAIGLGCMISPLAVIRNPEAIELGDDVRIDEYCIIDGGAGLKIGNHIHIASHATIYTGAGVQIGDYAMLSSFVLIESESDDFTGESLCGPAYPMKYKPGYISPGPVKLGRFVTIGARVTIMPGVTMAEGVAVGAHSFVRAPIETSWSIWAGSPAKFMRARARSMIELADRFEDEYRNGPREGRCEP
jgi:acetyltransferase-like isoleucine patch superfamily enzyme